MSANRDLAVYRFAIERIYHQQEHVLDEKGEHLLVARQPVRVDAPHDMHSMLANADIKHPTITLHDGRKVTLTYGQYNALLQTNRHQPDRAAAFQAFHETFAGNVRTRTRPSTTACCSATGSSRRRASYKSTLEAALHGNDIPPAVVENLVATAKAGTEPLRRYHRLRKRVLGLDTYHAYDQLVPLIDFDRKYEYCAGARRNRRVDEAARRRVSAERQARRSRGGGSTSTRTRASGAARIRRPCTACTRTCC